MNEFRPAQYIKQHLNWILGILLCLTVALYMVLNALQTYTASIVVDYTYEAAENGQAPDGSPIDVAEIYSSNVISQALQNLALDVQTHPIDVVRSGIKVEQVEDPTITAVNNAKNEDGETSDLQSTKYLISYTADSNQDEEVTRAILNEVVDVYFSRFSRKYVNSSSVVDRTSGIDNSVYDFIEQIELIIDNLDAAISSLNGRAEGDPAFYSAETGYSFNELLDEFTLLRDTQADALNAYILKHRVTRDLDTLLDKYGERLQDNQFAQEQNKARVSEVEGILDAYVAKLRESDNTAKPSVVGDGNSNESVYRNNVLGDVEDPTHDEEGNVTTDQTTEYEKLLQDWIDISDAYNRSVVEEAYTQYVIDCFQGNADAVQRYQQEVAQVKNLAGEDVALGVSGEQVQADALQASLSSDVYTETTVPCTQEDIDYVSEWMKAILARMSELFAITERTDEEYNAYVGAEYIQTVVSTQVRAGLNIPLYTALGAGLFLVVGCLGVIFVSRIGDIIEYLAFTDHQYHLPNRAACDRYIQNYREKVLPNGFACVHAQLLNQNEINARHGRKAGDEALAFFVSCLKSIVEGDPGAFVGYNGSGQFLMFMPQSSERALRDLVRQLQVMMEDHSRTNGIFARYSAGGAVADEDCCRIRALITRAIQSKQEYSAGKAEEETDGNRE